MGIEVPLSLGVAAVLGQTWRRQEIRSKMRWGGAGPKTTVLVDIVSPEEVEQLSSVLPTDLDFFGPNVEHAHHASNEVSDGLEVHAADTP